MDAAKKQEIIDDLDAFRSNMEFYRRTGRPWKRGYLLHGPPGTGKSTMIAAMANHLGYDIYDIELTVVRHNHDLRKLLVETTDRSIIVIEDIDCSLDLTGTRNGRRRKADSDSDNDSGGGRKQQGHAVRTAQVHRRALVVVRRRADHRVHHQSPRQARPGADPPRQDGHAH